MKPIGTRLISSHTFFVLTIIVISLTVLTVWLSGIEQHRTLFLNSMYSITFLSIAFCLFLTIGLYNGVKLKDDIGKVINNFKAVELMDFPSADLPKDFPDIDVGDEGCLGAILSVVVGIFIWLLVSFLFVLLLWVFSNVLWVTILVFIAMLYWIFFRALRLVFKNSNKCKGKLIASLAYGIAYTGLYNFWIYGIVLSTHYLLN